MSGLRVYTTIKRKDQEAANDALRAGVLEYDHRHGYRGPEGFHGLPEAGSEVEDAVEEALQDRDVVNELVAAVVLEASPREVRAMMRRGDEVKVSGDGLRFAAGSLATRNPDRAIRRGSIIRLQAGEKGGYVIAQVPRWSRAVALVRPTRGAVRLRGGSTTREQFTTDAGLAAARSSFKPSSIGRAREGLPPATVRTCPVRVDSAKTSASSGAQITTERRPRCPRTASNPRTWLSIRLCRRSGPVCAGLIQRFGSIRNAPGLLTGAGRRFLQPAADGHAYAIFANGGYRVKPGHLARRGQHASDLSRRPERGRGCRKVLDERNAFLMTRS